MTKEKDEDVELLKKLASKLPANFKGYMEGQDLLEISFHDSNVMDIKKENNNLNIIIQVDTYWFPGKPFAVLTLVDAINFEELIKNWQNMTSGLIREFKMIRTRYGGRTWPVLHAIFQEGEKESFEIPCSNFWFERVERYGDFKPADNRNNFSTDIREFSTN